MGFSWQLISSRVDEPGEGGEGRREDAVGIIVWSQNATLFLLSHSILPIVWPCYNMGKATPGANAAGGTTSSHLGGWILVTFIPHPMLLRCLFYWDSIMPYSTDMTQSGAPPVSAFRVLGWWLCTTMPGMVHTSYILQTGGQRALLEDLRTPELTMWDDQ